jgi:hypothetical protein
MMKKLAIAAALLFSLQAYADLKVELTLDKTEAVTGEIVPFRVTFTNTATFAVGALVQVINPEYSEIELTLTSMPGGWNCQGRISCHTSSFPASSQAQFGGFIITPTRPSPNFQLVASVQGGGDTDSSNNERAVRMPVVAAARAADLTVSAQPQTLQVASGAEVHFPVMVHNAGPDPAENLTARFQLSWSAAERFQVSGAGWRCEGYVCTRSFLAAGQSAPLEVVMTTPAGDAFIQLTTQVYALRNLDVSGAGMLATFYVGAREAWRMRLVPLSLRPVQGANGSLWKTEMTMLIRSGEPVEVEPDGCEPGAPECQGTGQPPLGQAFDPAQIWPVLFHGEHFLYVRAADFDNVRMNTRVHDANRFTQTAGAEIPSPRDDEFTSETITLLNIPVEPQYRHTLRIYDDAGRDGARVVIRIYADDEHEPRVTFAQVLRAKDTTTRVSTAQLPVYPALAQLTLGQLLATDGIESLRVEIQPIDPGVRIWSFVSITNNDTHHVTTVTPQ